MNWIIIMLMIALATASISYTVTTTYVFKWLRDLVSINKTLEKWIHCPWCFGHFVSIVILIILKDYMFFYNLPMWIHAVLNWFSIMTIVGLIHYFLLKAYDPIAKSEAIRELEKRSQ